MFGTFINHWFEAARVSTAKIQKILLSYPTPILIMVQSTLFWCWWTLTLSVSWQASPTPLLLASSWLGLASVGQLSFPSGIPSPSESWQASPTPLPSTSSWLGFASDGQLSVASGIPSPSASAAAVEVILVVGATGDVVDVVVAVPDEERHCLSPVTLEQSHSHL